MNTQSLEQEIKNEEELLFGERKRLKEKEKRLVELKVSLREQTLQLQFNEFIRKQANTTQDSVHLNNVLLHAAMVSYYYDIHRYKDFSASKWANKHKQAAYTIKWIVKFRPIQIKERTKNVTNEVLDINLKFALVCGFAFLGREMTDLIMSDKKKVDLQNKKEDKEKENSFYDKLLYITRYRPLSGKQLISIFEALELARS